MQRITSFATCRDLAGLAAALSSKTVQPWKRTSRSASYAPAHQQSTKLPFGQSVRGLRRPRIAVSPFAGHVHRLYGTAGEERGSKKTVITVVGIPDPITWIRCKCDILIIELLFELGLGSKEFENGVKQAVVHASQMMSSRQFAQLKRVASNETVQYVKKKCASLSEEQRQALAVSLEDIIFLLPEEVSVLQDDNGRKVCLITMRLWFLSILEGPDDHEATKIFRVAPNGDGSSPQKKIVTAVYEFRQELRTGRPPEWEITNIWHWHWTLTE
ncbi:m-AAA protease-interacting protein 1, mitochondrial [Gadus morhua]|uniref:Si:dkey-82o10.4 n=1 Tax=Gadus morhua TaxID=8049 RepID=A0A8C4Z5L7_GADMO|nr:m-AAA protease-interacting protein 1, mitochondrial-like [Gadus morhua]